MQLLFCIAFLTGWHQIILNRLAAPRQWHQVVHGQLFRLEFLFAIVTDPALDLFIPPWGFPQLPSLVSLGLDPFRIRIFPV